MRRLLSTFALLLVALAGSAESWDALYAARLEASSTYLESKLALKSAEVALDQFRKPYLPTISIATSTGTALSLGSAGFTSGTLTTAVTLENVLGADISLKAPLKASSSGGITPGDPSLTIARDLFTEASADRLEAEAAVLTAKAAIKKAKDGVRITLATEILNAVYYKRLLEVNNANLLVLERVRNATLNATLQRELERRVLGARKSVLVASNALANLGDEIKNDAATLYEEVLRMQATWTASIEQNEPQSSVSIHALELSLEAAERRREFSLLPFLPNPRLSGSLTYDVDKQRLDWGFSLALSYDVIDKGAKSLSALKREEYPRIFTLKLQDAKKSLADGIRKTRETMQILDLDKKLQDLDVADAQDYLDLMQRLFKGGYASEEDFVIAQIDLSVEQIEAQRISHDILIQTLNLSNYYDSE